MSNPPKPIYKDPNTGTEIAFVDTSKEVKKAIEKLSKEALGASAKVIRKKLRDKVPIRTKRFKNHIASWKFIDRKTGQPTLHIGFYSWQTVKKKKKLPSRANPHWIEFGAKQHYITTKKKKVLYWKDAYGTVVNHPGQQASHLLRNTINDNIAEIRAAQEDYLKKISEVLDAADIHVSDTADEETD